MPKPKILFVEDDPAQAAVLHQLLMRDGLEAHDADSLQKAERILERLRPDLVLLDLNLGDGNGRRLLARLQSITPQIPVMMLSGVTDPAARVRALTEGADDFVLKPFHPEELLARIQAVLRRSHRSQEAPSNPSGPWSSPKQIVFHRFVLDLSTDELRDLQAKGQAIRLSPVSFSLLRLLATHPYQPQSREVISMICFGRDHAPMSRAIDMQIAELRKRIEPNPKMPQFLKTVRNKGYVFTPNDAPTAPQPGPQSPRLGP